MPLRASDASMYSGTMSGEASRGRISRCSRRCGGPPSSAAASRVGAVAVVAFMVLLVGGARRPPRSGRAAGSGAQQVGQLAVGDRQGRADGPVHVGVLVGAEPSPEGGAGLGIGELAVGEQALAVAAGVDGVVRLVAGV